MVFITSNFFGLPCIDINYHMEKIHKIVRIKFTFCRNYYYDLVPVYTPGIRPHKYYVQFLGGTSASWTY